MRIKSKPTTKNRSFIVVLAVLVLASSYLFVAHRYDIWPFVQQTPSSSGENDSIQSKPDQNSAPTTQQINSGAQVKEQIANNNSSNTGANEESSSQPLSVVISSVNVTPDKQTVMIRTLIGSILSSGTCSLAMKNSSGKIYEATARVQVLASNSTCAGFNVPMSSLSGGKWSIAITVSDGSSSGQAVQEVQL